MQKLKVLSVIDSLGPGGAEYHLYHLCRGLRHSPVSMDVFALHKQGDFYSQSIRKTGSNVFFGGPTPSRLWQIVPRLVSTIHKGRYRVVHLYLAASTLIGAIAARLVGNSFVVTTVCARKAQFKGVLQNFKNYSRLKSLIHRYITTDPQELISIGIPREKITLSAFATDNFLRNIPKCGDKLRIVMDYGLTDAFPVVVSAGRLNPDKGFAFAIEAFSQVLLHYPKAKLLILGDGPDKEKLMGLAAKKGMKDHVAFTGVQRNMAAFFCAGTIYLNVSVNEGVNLSHLQAMASGLPSIKFDVPTVGYLAPNFSKCIRFSPALDSEALARNIVSLCGNRGERAQMAEQGKEYFRKYQSLDPVGVYLGLYQSQPFLPRLKQYRLSEKDFGKAERGRQLAPYFHER